MVFSCEKRTPESSCLGTAQIFCCFHRSACGPGGPLVCKVMLCSGKCGSEACRVGRAGGGRSSAGIPAALAQTSCAFAPASLSPSTHVALAKYHRATERGHGLQVTARGSGKGSLPLPGGELFRQRRKKVIPTGSIHTFSGDFVPCHCRSSCFRQACTSSTQTPVSCCVCCL